MARCLSVSVTSRRSIETPGRNYTERNPTLGNRVWATFFVLTSVTSSRGLGLELGLRLVSEVWVTFRY